MLDKLLLGKPEAATMLGLSVRSIEWLIRQGRLPSKKLGKRRLIPRAAVEKLAQTGTGQIVPTPTTKTEGKRRAS